jgi:hypothetical protein
MDSVESGLPHRMTPFAPAIYAAHQLARVFKSHPRRFSLNPLPCVQTKRAQILSSFQIEDA